MLKYLAPLALIAALILPAASAIGQSQKPKYMESVAPLQMSGRNICTATYINSVEDYWLTAAHCIPVASVTDDGETVIFVSETLTIREVPVTDMFVDVPNDIAVVRAPGSWGPDLGLSKKDVEFGEEIKVAGHPHGVPFPLLFKGSVANPRAMEDGYDFMLYDMTAGPGNSGSAVLNKDNKIVSVLQIGYGIQDQPFGDLTGGSPWQTLRKFAMKYFRVK